MAQVTVQIDGKAYRMACEEGQEGHLDRTCRPVRPLCDAPEVAIRRDRRSSPHGHGGIMVMDELSDVSRRLKALETETENLARSRESMLAASERATRCSSPRLAS